MTLSTLRWVIMTVEIEYCGMWNYLPEATRVAAELKENLGIEVTLVEGSKGIFEIRVDAEVVFNKKVTGKFPEPEEVTDLFRKRWKRAPEPATVLWW